METPIQKIDSEIQCTVAIKSMLFPINVCTFSHVTNICSNDLNFRLLFWDLGKVERKFKKHVNSTYIKQL